MWNWIKGKLVSAFNFVKNAATKVGEWILELIEAVSSEVDEYCGDSKLRKLVVGIALIAAVCLATVYATSSVFSFLVALALGVVFIVFLETVGDVFTASGPVDALFTMVVGLGKAIMVVIVIKFIPLAVLLWGSVFIAEAIHSWCMEHRVRCAVRRCNARREESSLEEGTAALVA